MSEEKYCIACGRELIRIKVPAEKLKFTICTPYGDCSEEMLGTKFNKHTGKRQFGIRVKCPNANWFNRCTDYVDEESLHDRDLPDLKTL